MAIVSFDLLCNPASSNPTLTDKVYVAVPETELVKIFNKSHNDSTIVDAVSSAIQITTLLAFIVGGGYAISINMYRMSDIQTLMAILSAIVLSIVICASSIKPIKLLRNYLKSRAHSFEFTQDGYSNVLAQLAITGKAVHIECTSGKAQTSKDTLPTREWGLFKAALYDTFNSKCIEGDISFNEVNELLESKLTYGHIDKEIKDIVDRYIVHALSHDFTKDQLLEDARLAAILTIDLIVRQIRDKNLLIDSKKNAARESYRSEMDPFGVHSELW